MSIEFACPCGKQYQVNESKAGRTFRCLSCHMELEVPVADQVDLGIATEPTQSKRSPAHDAAEVAVAQAYAPPASTRDRLPAQRVVVIDFDMPFWSLVWLLIKLAFAAIPALICVYVISAVFVGVLFLIALAFRGVTQ